MITNETIVRASDDQVSSELGDEAVVLSLSDGVYYGLNPVSARILSLVSEQPMSVEAICSALLEEFDVDEAQCMSDLKSVLEKMREHSLVEVEGP